ncbi:MAG: hypothetical protein BZY80_02830 [SAR202 cluster bacterium Io17-Chloro-G2]|nr:MAG: hypothetical protein BZY80_02830 [SAR202 cluster bacterium Io17-Chloro-G2]
MNYNREDLKSVYLCSYCEGLLYTDSSEPPRDVCFNQTCELWPKELTSIVDASAENEPQIYQELKEMEAVLESEIGQWDHGELARLTYRARKELITIAIDQGVMPSLDFWFAIGELLLLINKRPPSGVITDIERFKALLEVTRKWSFHHRNLEDLRTKRYYIGRTEAELRVFWIKYASAIRENQKSLGLMSIGDLGDAEDPFTYSFLEDTVVADADPGTTTDLSEWFDTLWQMSLQMRYAFRSHARTLHQYDYKPNPVDMSVLAGWHLKMIETNDTGVWSFDDLGNLHEHISQYSCGRRSASDFLNHYVDHTELVPVVVRTPDGLIMDRLTIIYFLIYLHGCLMPTDDIGPSIDEPILNKIRSRLGPRFKDWLRKEIHNHGYNGPDEAVTIRAQGQTFEYDILALSEDARCIMLADAKYRDMAPSSFTGANLIRQELLGKGGLRDEACRQQLRLEFFQKNVDSFTQYLAPKRPWEEYDVRSYLITKHIPLAHQFRDTRMMLAAEFLRTELS